MVDLRKMLGYDEGLRLTAYLCPARKLTVGYGHNLDADKALSILHRNINIGDKITLDEADKLLDYDIQKAVSGINKKLPGFSDLQEKYRVVLINMAFNIGINGILTFKNTIKSMFANNDVAVIAGIKNSAYYRQVTNRANRMISIIKGVIPSEYS